MTLRHGSRSGALFGRGGATQYLQDLANSDCIVVMGGNMAEAHPVGFQWVEEARRRSAVVVHVDPRFTRTSAQADRHIPIRVGGDIALLGGLINHVLSHDLWFREYVAAYTNAATIVDDRLRDTEDLDGLFSGFDSGRRRVRPVVVGLRGSGPGSQGRTEARLYGANPDDGVGGTGSIFLLLDEPEVHGLPPDPVVTTKALPAMFLHAGIAGTVMMGVVATPIAVADGSAAVGTAFFAPPLAAYTAVLLSDTAVPTWHASYRELPALFVSSALAAGSGLALITTSAAETGPVRAPAAVAAASDLVAGEALGRRLGVLAEPLHAGRSWAPAQRRPRPDRRWGPGAAVSGRSRLADAASGLALLACTRFSTFEAGMASARDPKYTVVPQRASADAAAARGEAITQPGGAWPSATMKEER